jgi:Spy/CpxP family protein refolding chaperone
MKLSTVRSIVLTTLAASVIYAQSTSAPAPPTPPTPAQQATQLVNRFTTLLDLTSAQQTAATTIFTTEFTTLATLQTSFQTARTSFQTAIEGNSLSAINTVAAQIGNLTQQQVVAQGTADMDFYAQLTATQQTKYTTLNLGALGGPGFGGPGRGRGGPGGPGGPPPPGN